MSVLKRMDLYYEQFFSYEKVNQFLSQGLAVDGTAGGLVLGPFHNSNDSFTSGVKFLMDMGDGYEVTGEAEGFEYIPSQAAATLLRDDFDTLNNPERDYEDPFIEFVQGDEIMIIDARLPPGLLLHSKIVILEGPIGAMIINKHSTKKFLTAINDINVSYRHEYDSENYFGRNNISVYDKISGSLVTKRRILWKSDKK